MKFIQSLIGIASIAFSTFSYAAIIQNSGPSGSFDQLIDFESVSLATNQIVTTEFSSEGLTIFNHAGNVYANSCGYNSSGTGNYINTYGPNCVTNTEYQDFSLIFDRDIDSLTWLVGYTGGGINYSTYLDGVLVESLNDVILTRHSHTTFTGLFDEIRVTEVIAPAYTMFDNLQISYAAVPESPTIALMSVGLIGLIAATRRRKKAN